MKAVRPHDFHSFTCIAVHELMWLSDVTCNHDGENGSPGKQRETEGNKRKINGRIIILTQFFLTCSARKLQGLVEFCTDVICFH